MKQANFEASVGQGVAARTRGVQGALRAVVNGTTNLNVTTRDINQKKKGSCVNFFYDVLCRAESIPIPNDS